MTKTGKTRFSLMPVESLALVLRVLEFGAVKHKEFGWLEYDKRTYFDACHRHLMAWQGGVTTDEESGLPHLAHAATNILFALALELRGNDGRNKT